MNKMKCIFPFVIGLLAVPVAMAQDVDFEKEFDSFQKQQQKEFNDFKNKADADFDTFLREAWTKFEAFDAVEAPVNNRYLMVNGHKHPLKLNRLLQEYREWKDLLWMGNQLR